MNRELVRWGLPAAALLVVFVLYTSIASIVLVASGAPAAMSAAADGDLASGTDGVPEDGGDADDPDAEPEPDPVATPVATDPRLPASCDELFSPGVVSAANAAGLVLNPEWSVGTDPAGLSLQDPTLAAMLADQPSIDCRWLSPNGGSGVGIRSVIAVVTAEEAAALNGQFAALGYRPQNELGGTRYFFEANAGGTPYGESHIVRDGIWFATHWLSYGPRGYTADMVTNYFG
jgi:hypothetical protein